MLADTDCFGQRLAWECQLRMGHHYFYIPHCRENLDRITHDEIVIMEIALWTGNRTSSLCEPRGVSQDSVKGGGQHPGL